jgi:hypothetical protein
MPTAGDEVAVGVELAGGLDEQPLAAPSELAAYERTSGTGRASSSTASSERSRSSCSTTYEGYAADDTESGDGPWASRN